MIISGIQKLSLVDYDKEVSSTLFFAGCNFRCPFCHNYEFVLFNSNTIESIPIGEILEYIEKNKEYLTGIVISGGEPTINLDLKELILEIKKTGLKIKLDTNGTNPEMVMDLLNNGLIDYVAMDIKNSLSKYEETIGTKTDLLKIKKTIKFLIESDFDYEFRTTLINEFHDSESISEMGDLIRGAKRVFLQKFVLSDNVPNKSLTPVETKNALEFKRILESKVKFVGLRGY